MRRPVVAGNWKMHGSGASIDRLLDQLVQQPVAGVDVLVLPPMAYLSKVVARLRGTSIAVGAQNAYFESGGAFTGEVAPEMVADVGATHVLVGHSERRQYFGDTDEWIARKMAAAFRAGLVPVLCVGETLAERESGRAETVVVEQLRRATREIDAVMLRSTMIAYEPVWAIGTGRSASPADAQSMHGAIRGWLRANVAGAGETVRILYGGSINAANAAALFAGADVDGGLVGGASLDAKQFVQICGAAQAMASTES